MSRQADEARAGKGRGKDANKPPKGRVISFHPTDQERIALKEGEMELSEAVKVLEQFLLSGDYKLSVSRTSVNDCFAVSLREVVEDWTQANMLSTFHVDLEKAFRGLAYAIEGRYSSWPNNQTGQLAFTDDW